MTTGLPGVRQLVFDDLVKQARSHIPQLCEEWTHHGPTDPGITMIELVASFAEMLTYRASRQTDAITRTFLELLSGEESSRSGEELEDTLHRTLAELWTRYRAATLEDYRYLALEEWPKTSDARNLGDDGLIHRVHCLGERNLANKNPLSPAPGRVSIIVVPKHADQPTQSLKNRLWNFFEPRRLLTTRHHVVGPQYVDLTIHAQVYLLDGASRSAVVEQAATVLTKWLDPHEGGESGHGWPFGGNVYFSSIYRELDKISGVDFVKHVAVQGPHPSRDLKNTDGDSIGIRIDPHELVRLTFDNISVSLFEFAAGEWREVTV